MAGTDLERVEVVDPRTMEVLDLATVPHTDLIEVFQRLQDYERRAREWRTAAEDELVRRHGDRRSAQVVGDWEIDVDRGYSRVWDPEELLAVTSDLFKRRMLRASDLAGLVRNEQKVDGRRALTLLNRADAATVAELRRCFRWEQRGRAKVKVTPVVQLPAG